MGKLSQTSRRDFLKGSALVGASAAGAALLTACSSTPAAGTGSDTAAAITWDKETDILVIGGGVGGTIAAYTAGTGGAKTIVVEAGKELGGTALISSGSIHSSSLASPEDVATKLSTGDQILGKAYMENWLKIYDNWLVDTGAPCEKAQGGMISVSFGGADFEKRKAFFQFFEDKLDELGVEKIFHTKGIKLFADESGAITGAKLQGYDGSVTLVGAKKVILACGGFGANTELAVRYWGPWADKLVHRSVPHNTGDGLIMALEHDAKLSQSFGWFYGHVEAYPALVPQTPAEFEDFDKGLARDLLAAIQTFSARGFFINMAGKRFCNENGSSEIGGRFCEYILRQDKGRVMLVLDSSAGMEGNLESIDMLVENGMDMDTAQSFDELCDMMAKRGVNRANFVRTVQEYQATDPANLEIPKTPSQDYITKMDTPPFYIIPITGAPSASFGGVAIDTEAHVLRSSNQPIPNLFATACTAGGFFYNEYGGSLGASTTFGKVAAETALSEL